MLVNESANDLNLLCNNMEKLVLHSKATNTWSKHCAAWSLFNEYCNKNFVSENWPANVKTVREFVAWALMERKLKPNTVKSYLYSIKLAHTLRDITCCDFNKDDIIKMMLMGAENLKSIECASKKDRPPMSISSLQIVGHRIAVTNWKDFSKQVIWTACVISFFSSCRMGELLAPHENSFDPKTTLLWKHVIFKENYATIFIPFSKTKKFSGRLLEIFEYEDIAACCPYNALCNLERMAKNSKILQLETPVFTFESGKFLTTAKLNKILKDLMSDVGQGKINYSCHSFRAAIPSLISSHPDKGFVSEILDWGEWETVDSSRLYTKLNHDRRKYLFNKVALLLKTSNNK